VDVGNGDVCMYSVFRGSTASWLDVDLVLTLLLEKTLSYLHFPALDLGT